MVSEGKLMLTRKALGHLFNLSVMYIRDNGEPCSLKTLMIWAKLCAHGGFFYRCFSKSLLFNNVTC